MNSFVSLVVEDVRFPTSRFLDGSDAMNPDPDYSSAYVTVRTSDGDEGHGHVFTIGRGNDVQVAAIRALGARLVGQSVDGVLDDMGSFARELSSDSQWRWLGPEKGIAHMAVGAVVNALWDLKARREKTPLWLLLARMSPEQIVDLVDFRYLEDALTREQALEILRAAEPGRENRIVELQQQGYPAYTTTPGWLGYSDEKLARLCREAIDQGFGQIKLKVGNSIEEDRRRLAIAREVCGEGFPIAIDANQRWGTEEAIEWVRGLAEFDLAWVEEPTNPDDILALAAIGEAIAPIRVATGEHTANRVMFKQLLQAGATSIVQIDACRVAGVNENIAIMLMAAQFGIPVCPHAGGVGLCEAVQHLSFFDYAAISGVKDGRMIEFVDHLHEHFVDPVVVTGGNYVAPTMAGASTQMRPASVDEFRFPDGQYWLEDALGEHDSAEPAGVGHER